MKKHIKKMNVQLKRLLALTLALFTIASMATTPVSAMAIVHPFLERM